MEHRWGDRRPVILRIRVHGPDAASAAAWLTQVSLSGGYVSTLVPLAPMRLIEIEVAARDGDAVLGPLRLTGRVVRQGPMGMGVEWTEFASETLREVLRIAVSLPDHRPHGARSRPLGPWASGAVPGDACGADAP